MDRTSAQNTLPIKIRAVHLLNIFRLVLSLGLIGLYWYVGQQHWVGDENSQLFLYLSIAYLTFSALILLIDSLKLMVSSFLQSLQFVIDILFIIFLMSAAGGIVLENALGLGAAPDLARELVQREHHDV